MNHKFKNRTEAGGLLGAELKAHSLESNLVILALPRGGVPVAYEIAQQLKVPMDVFLVRKLGSPINPELAIGAIAEDDVIVLNQPLIAELDVSENSINKIIDHEKIELFRRRKVYREGRSLINLEKKTIILVDDGIATGATIQAAIAALKKSKIKSIIIAVPVASPDTVLKLKPMVDQLICLSMPTPFYGVGQWYEEFNQLSDEETCRYLNSSKVYSE
jgi:putative phosphoribosyl transferase